MNACSGPSTETIGIKLIAKIEWAYVYLRTDKQVCRHEGGCTKQAFAIEGSLPPSRTQPVRTLRQTHESHHAARRPLVGSSLFRGLVLTLLFAHVSTSEATSRGIYPPAASVAVWMPNGSHSCPARWNTPIALFYQVLSARSRADPSLQRSLGCHDFITAMSTLFVQAMPFLRAMRRKSTQCH
ncbi:hypothetical protein V2G26_019722 [Clonostachys chloroleuca]